MNHKQPLVMIDTDPGIDDSLALFLASKLLRGRIGAVVASYGNLPLEITLRNALDLCKLFEIDCPVFAGAKRPAEHDFTPAANIHGDNGIGGVVLPKSNIAPQRFEDLLQWIKIQPRVDYIALGPLTNLATILTTDRQAAQKLGRVVVMGGGINQTNMPGQSEFNFHCDPYSADIVMQSGLDLSVIGLDVTCNVFFDTEQIDRYFAPKSGALEKIHPMLRFCHKTNTEFGEAGAVMHDGTAVLHYCYPTEFFMLETGLRISTDPKTYGKCLLDHTTKPIRFGAYCRTDVLKQHIIDCAKL